ncbi:HAD family hydrolase [Altererythrobacter sp. H2]|uniref:HAD family hydrolase n=1 Tax=Altererythrobacter sp. H2 TaxID=3108391 RepID=UPI002B4BED30|nr:HAD family hydrolase [Altererythrobacter sp. H2]WRK97250.1 HAD family hydrolase [Altererythrobacter sp. H2]
MTQFPFSAVGFDLDGTLCDTFRDLGAAVNHALRIGGLDEVSIESSKDLIGGGAKVMLARAVEAQTGHLGGLPEPEFNALYKQMLGFYAENNAVHTVPYPGALEAMDELAARGARLAVVTNKFEAFATALLGQLGLSERFVTIIGGDSLGKGPDGKFRAKPLPDPVIEARARCGGGTFAFIGDSTYDVAAAKGAGVPVVVAAYGYCDRAPHELGGDAVIDSLHGLIPALEAL